MNGIAEIDKAGRLVVPKKVREAMHVRAGDRFRVEYTEDTIVLHPERPKPRMYRKDGMWVFDPGGNEVLTQKMVSQVIRQQREERERRMSGLE